MMKLHKIFYLSMLLFPLSGYTNQEEPSKEQETVIVSSLNGIVLTNDAAELKHPNQTRQHGILVHGLMANPKGLERYLNQYIGCPLTKNTINSITQAVSQYYQDKGYPLVQVSVPEQEVTTGTLQLVVVESRLGEVRTEGNKWISDSSLKNRLSVQEGEPINVNQLNDDLYHMNKNSEFCQADCVFVPGKENGTTDIELKCKDRLPVRIFAGMDNRGNRFIGDERQFEGFTVVDPWGKGQSLTYQFTSTLDFRKLRAHGGHFDSQLPWGDYLTVYGGHAEVHAKIRPTPGQNQGIFRQDGKTDQASFRYLHLLCPAKEGHFIDFGFDWKQTNNSILFSGAPQFGKTVALTQFVASYHWQHSDCGWFHTLDAEVFFSPAEWIQHQSLEDFQSLRPHSNNKYIYARAMLDSYYWFKNGAYAHTTFRGQVANENLLPSEEFALGGADTVRGYEEWEFISENGILANFELYSPPTTVLGRFNFPGLCRPVMDQLRFLVFFDIGAATSTHRISGLNTSNWLASVGPGLRYNIGPFLQARADWGFQLHKTPFNAGYDNYLHFSVVANY